MEAKLVVVGGDAKMKEIRLKLPAIVGRGKGSTLKLPHALVSRQHCEIFEANGKLMVRDLGSLNGTFINNQRITEAELPAGELLSIGTVTFRAVYELDENQVPPATDPNKTVPESKVGKTKLVKPPTEAVSVAATPVATPVVAAPAKAGGKDEPIDFSELIGEDDDDELSDFELNDETKHAPPKFSDPQAATEQLPPAASAADASAAPDLPPAIVPAEAKPAKAEKPEQPAKPAAGKKGAAPEKPARPSPSSNPIPSSSDDDLSSFLKSLGK